VLLLPRLIVPWHIQCQIRRLTRQKGAISAELDKEVEHPVQFMADFQERMELVKQDLEWPTYSPLCTLWDQITRSYRSNPRALICPKCGAHNGLHDRPAQPVFICLKCKKTINSST
jgi:hypothetical protein